MLNGPSVMADCSCFMSTTISQHRWHVCWCVLVIGATSVSWRMKIFWLLLIFQRYQRKRVMRRVTYSCLMAGVGSLMSRVKKVCACSLYLWNLPLTPIFIHCLRFVATIYGHQAVSVNDAISLYQNIQPYSLFTLCLFAAPSYTVPIIF